MIELYEFINNRIKHVEESATSAMGVGRILELNIIKFKVEEILKNEKQQQIFKSDIKT